MATGGNKNCPPPLLEVSEKQKQEDECKQQLLQLEKEIQTLKKVLQAKCVEASELKAKLGISPIDDFKEDVKHGLQIIQESEAMQKTNAAIKSLGQYASKTIDNIKKSNAVKTIEDKVGSAYINVKQRLSNSNVSTNVTDGKPIEQNISKTDNNTTTNNNNSNTNVSNNNNNNNNILPNIPPNSLSNDYIIPDTALNTKQIPTSNSSSNDNSFEVIPDSNLSKNNPMPDVGLDVVKSGDEMKISK